MAQFESAVNFILANEGGLIKAENDPGGITNFGISFRFLLEVPPEVLKRAGIFEPVTEDTIRELTQEQAKILYRLMFWDTAPFEKIINSKLCNYIFDMCVQHGYGQGIKLAQRAVNACQKSATYLKDDGIMGAYTLQGINQASFMLIPALIAQRDGFIRLLVSKNPKREVFMDGWLNRCYRI